MSKFSCAVPDWQKRIVAGQSLIPNLKLFEPQASRAVDIFNSLHLPDVPGQPLLKDAAGEWQRDLVRAVFGSYDEKANNRNIREFFCMVPKKSSKTTAGAAIMLTALLMNKRPRAEFLLIAPTLEIADLAFRQVVGMIESVPVLKSKFHIQEHLKRITFIDEAKPGAGSFLKVKSFDPRVVTGSKPSGVLIDELHVIAENSQADRVMGQLRGGLLPNPEAFLITITTQSERPPSGVFKSALAQARSVRDGLVDLPILPLIYEFPDKVDWRDPANWHMVTPNNGRSITVDRLIPDYEAAKAAGEEELRRWASQHLNIEIGMALRSDAWPGAHYWEKAIDESISLDAIIERCDVCTVGIDGGGLDDLFGLAVIGRDRITREWIGWTHAWAFTSVLERRKSEAVKLRDFANDGDVTIIDRLGDDVSEVIEIVMRLEEAGLLACVGLDPVGVGAVVDALAEAGISGDERVKGVSQGFRLSGAIKTLERKLADGTFWHSGQPLMSWMVSNAKVEPRGNAVLVTKQASGSAKIDALAALFNAVALMSLNPESTSSVYNDAGHEFLIL